MFIEHIQLCSVLHFYFMINNIIVFILVRLMQQYAMHYYHGLVT